MFASDAAYVAGVIPGMDHSSSIRRVMLVGAQTMAGNPDRLTDRDRGHLFYAFTAAAKLNIAVHPDFEIDVVNIHPDFGGRSFLKETARADMVVLCFVFNPDPADRPAIAYHASPRHGDRFIDADHARPGIWHDSALRVGAKIVAVMTGNGMVGAASEINHRHFTHIAGGQYVQRDNFDQRHAVTMVSRRI